MTCMRELVDILHREHCSCVIRNRGNIKLCHSRGVKDLYDLVHDGSGLLHDAEIADKVVGKGAAALMIAGGVAAVYADVISIPALGLLESAAVAVDYAALVPNIINRAGTGICPVETLCRDCTTAEECLPIIAGFISRMNMDNQNNNQ